SLAQLLGGKERLENLLDDIGRHARARVLDLDQYVVGRRHARVAETGRLRGRYVARTDGDRAAVRHRIAGIDDKVDDHLLELHEIGLDRPDALRMVDLERDGFPDQPLEQDREVVEVAGNFEDL